MGVSGQLHTPAALFPGKEPWYPLNRTLGETQYWSLFPLLGFEPSQ